jgi:hypothetical protein
MTLSQFENGYWYATEVKDFGKTIGIPIDCYINFTSDFLAAEKGATREQAIKAWRKLKSLDVPKNYRAWAQVRSPKSK